MASIGQVQLYHALKQLNNFIGAKKHGLDGIDFVIKLRYAYLTATDGYTLLNIKIPLKDTTKTGSFQLSKADVAAVIEKLEQKRSGYSKIGLEDDNVRIAGLDFKPYELIDVSSPLSDKYKKKGYKTSKLTVEQALGRLKGKKVVTVTGTTFKVKDLKKCITAVSDGDFITMYYKEGVRVHILESGNRICLVAGDL